MRGVQRSPEQLAGVHERQILAGKYRVERVLGVDAPPPDARLRSQLHDRPQIGRPYLQAPQCFIE